MCPLSIERYYFPLFVDFNLFRWTSLCVFVVVVVV